MCCLLAASSVVMCGVGQGIGLALSFAQTATLWWAAGIGLVLYACIAG